MPVVKIRIIGVEDLVEQFVDVFSKFECSQPQKGAYLPQNAHSYPLDRIDYKVQENSESIHI